MAKHEGLLLKIDSKENISGYMQENDNKIPIDNTTIKDELISFSEEDFEEYSELQNEIRKVYRPHPDKSKERFALIKNLTAKAEKALAKYRAFYGLLNRLMIEDFLGEDDATEHYLREYASYLDQIKSVQFFVLHFFSDLSNKKEIDINEDFNYNSVQISTVFYFEDNKSKQMYHIRNLTKYYFLLLHLFVEHGYRLCRCQALRQILCAKDKKENPVLRQSSEKRKNLQGICAEIKAPSLGKQK